MTKTSPNYDNCISPLPSEGFNSSSSNMCLRSNSLSEAILIFWSEKLLKHNYNMFYCLLQDTCRSNFPTACKKQSPTAEKGRVTVEWQRSGSSALTALAGPGTDAACSLTRQIYFRHILDKYLYTINCINKSLGLGKLFRRMSITDFTKR